MDAGGKAARVAGCESSLNFRWWWGSAFRFGEQWGGKSTDLMIDSRDSVRRASRRILEYPACFTVKTRMLVTKRQSPEIEQAKGWECIGFRKTAFGQSRRFYPVGGCLYGFGAQRRTTEIIGSSVYGLRCLRGCMHTCCMGWEPARQKALGRGPIQPRLYTCGLSVSTC